MIPQFETTYFAEVLPFVFPRVCSGPDFWPDKRPRRPDDAPLVSPQEFVAGCARRAESQFRNDWTAVPAMRHVLHSWQAEHTMSTLSAHEGRAGSALAAECSEKIAAMKKLYEVLHKGSVGQGQPGAKKGSVAPTREPKTPGRAPNSKPMFPEEFDDPFGEQPRTTRRWFM